MEKKEIQTVRQLQLWGRKKLAALINSDPYLFYDEETCRIEADYLLQEATGITKVQLITSDKSHIEADKTEKFYRFIERRLQHEPVAYITGHQEFFSIDFLVSPATLIPRSETELLVERALQILKERTSNRTNRIIDIGTGSGAIIVATLKTLSQDGKHNLPLALAADISEEALEIAKINAQRQGLASEIQFILSDLFVSIPDDESDFELVISNPPYISTNDSLPETVSRFEPGLALFSGKDGMNAINMLLSEFSKRKAKHRILLAEFGSTQISLIEAELKKYQFPYTKIHKDLSGKDRFLEVQITT